MSSIIHQTGNVRPLSLQEREQPQLYRELFPYTSICRTTFDEVLLAPRPAEQMRITDTTFRDGQQARPPYTVKQVAKIFDFLHRMGGKTGLITASEFFLYSAKDRKCIDVCRARGYRFPRVTSWIRANKEDLKLARDMEFDETGMLTSVSDYHIYLKLGKTRQQAMDMYLDLARQALEDEVDLTPKPGLVDRRNTGAHDDMDRPLFHRSAQVLEPYFCRFVSLGMAAASPEKLQALGREAEEAMLAATGGVNTHKGALYSFALLLSALGRCLAEGGGPFETAAAIAAALPPASGTHGSTVRAQCGSVRQEAVSGFSTARHMRGLLESAGPLSALVWAMSRLDDSTLVYRGGPQGLAYVRRRAAELLRLPEEALPPALEALDDDLMARRLSPGGSADLLALALFLRAAAPETWL